jgi:hypothetical protein
MLDLQRPNSISKQTRLDSCSSDHNDSLLGDAGVARKTQAAAGSAAPDGLRRRVAAPAPFGRSRRVQQLMAKARHVVWRAKLWQQS